VPGDVATYYRDGKKIHSFKEGRWNLELRAKFMKRDGFDVQVLISDNRPLIYEVDPDLGRWRGLTTTPLRKIFGTTIALLVARGFIYRTFKNRFASCGERSKSSR
jgi:hypothetical protein